MDKLIDTFIFRVIYWIVFLSILGPAIKYVYTAKRKTTVKLLFAIQLGIIILSTIPFILFNDTRVSILNLALNGYFWFAVMLMSYILALVFLIPHRQILQNLSFLLFGIGFLATWVAVFKYIPDSTINNDKLTGLLWVFVFMILPLGVLLLYLNITASYYKKKDIAFKPSIMSGPTVSQKTVFRVRISYFYYFFFGSLIILLISTLIYNAPAIIKGLSLISILFVLIVLWVILYLISILFGNTISLTGEILNIPVRRGSFFIFSSHKKIELGEIESVILATGKYLRELADQTHNTDLQKKIEKHNPRRFVSSDFLQFLYIIKRQAPDQLFNVSFCANKKLLRLAQEFARRNIKTEVHL